MASQSTGIQQLLAAEKKSAEKVAEARKRTLVLVCYGSCSDTQLTLKNAPSTTGVDVINIKVRTDHIIRYV